MKKIVLFVSVLLLTGSLFAAAPVFEAKPAISGDATVTFGINLDTKPNVATGITNSISQNLTLHLVNKDADAKGGKEGEEVYGWINLKDFEMNIDGTLSVTKPGIEAKLFLGPVYINILGDSNGVNKTGSGMDIGTTQTASGDATWDVLGLTPAVSAVATKFSYQNAGLYIGLKDTSIVDVKLGVQSRFNWTATDAGAATGVFYIADGKEKADTAVTYTTLAGGAQALPLTAGVAYIKTTAGSAALAANTDNLYVGWLSADLNAVPGLIFGLKANLGGFSATTIGWGLGVKAGYGIALMEGVKLTPEVGFDLTDVQDWRLEAGLGLTMPGDKKDDYTKFGGKFDLKPGLSVLFATGGNFKTVATTAPVDLEIALFDGSLIPVLDLVAVAEIYNLAATNPNLGFGVFASADLTQIVPYLGFQATKLGAANLNAVIFQAGFDVKVITNTTFTVAYKSGDLSLATPGLGIITVACKIAY